MRDAVIKYGLFYGALLVVGAIAWRLTSLATDAAGGHGATMLSSSSLGLSVGVGLAAIAIAVATGMLATRLHSASAGVLDMGVVLAWGASGFGTLRQVVSARAVAETGAGMRSTLSMLAIEAAIVGALVVAAVFLIERAEKRSEPAEEPKAGAWMTSLACGAAGSAVGIWFIAQTGYKGQVIGAALVGGLLGGVAAFAVDPRTRMWPLVAGCAAVSIAGPVLAMVAGGDDAHLHAAVIAGSVTRLAQPVGLDGIAGACMGVPVGLYIAKGLLGHAGQIAEQSH
ncbi:MAG: hypothetical protein QM783_05190 [Phycisphaerales bacterium]